MQNNLDNMAERQSSPDRDKRKIMVDTRVNYKPKFDNKKDNKANFDNSAFMQPSSGWDERKIRIHNRAYTKPKFYKRKYNKPDSYSVFETDMKFERITDLHEIAGNKQKFENNAENTSKLEHSAKTEPNLDEIMEMKSNFTNKVAMRSSLNRFESKSKFNRRLGWKLNRAVNVQNSDNRTDNLPDDKIINSDSMAEMLTKSDKDERKTMVHDRTNYKPGFDNKRNLHNSFETDKKLVNRAENISDLDNIGGSKLELKNSAENTSELEYNAKNIPNLDKRTNMKFNFANEAEMKPDWNNGLERKLKFHKRRSEWKRSRPVNVQNLNNGGEDVSKLNNSDKNVHEDNKTDNVSKLDNKTDMKPNSGNGNKQNVGKNAEIKYNLANTAGMKCKCKFKKRFECNCNLNVAENVPKVSSRIVANFDNGAKSKLKPDKMVECTLKLDKSLENEPILDINFASKQELDNGTKTNLESDNKLQSKPNFTNRSEIKPMKDYTDTVESDNRGNGAKSKPDLSRRRIMEEKFALLFNPNDCNVRKRSVSKPKIDNSVETRRKLDNSAVSKPGIYYCSEIESGIYNGAESLRKENEKSKYKAEAKSKVKENKMTDGKLKKRNQNKSMLGNDAETESSLDNRVEIKYKFKKKLSKGRFKTVSLLNTSVETVEYLAHHVEMSLSTIPRFPVDINFKFRLYRDLKKYNWDAIWYAILTGFRIIEVFENKMAPKKEIIALALRFYAAYNRLRCSLDHMAKILKNHDF